MTKKNVEDVEDILEEKVEPVPLKKEEPEVMEKKKKKTVLNLKIMQKKTNTTQA